MRRGREAAALAVERRTLHPLWWESASLVTWEPETGEVLRGRAETACRSRRYRGDRRFGVDALSTERLEGRSLRCGYFELAALRIQQSLALPEKHEIASDQALVSCYSSKVK